VTQYGPDDTRQDDLRPVDLFDEEPPVLPDQTGDDTDLGWGEREADDIERLLEDRPPHWG
jgi:hypothetical protein